jgi:hypothetical protein
MSVQALVDGYKLVLVNATGPSAAVSVAAGSSATVNLAVVAGPANVLAILGLQSVSGLPSGVVLSGVSYPDVNTVSLTVYNPTAAAVSVGAGAVTATVLAKAV